MGMNEVRIEIRTERIVGFAPEDTRMDRKAKGRLILPAFNEGYDFGLFEVLIECIGNDANHKDSFSSSIPALFSCATMSA